MTHTRGRSTSIFIQAEVNDLTRDLILSKGFGQWLGSNLKEKHLLALGTMFYWYRDHERELRQFFAFLDKSSLVYCNNMARLIKSMGLKYDATELRLFIDSFISKRFFYIMGIGLIYPFWSFNTNEKLTTPWIICCLLIRGSLNKFPEFYYIGTFIDSKHFYW